MSARSIRRSRVVGSTAAVLDRPAPARVALLVAALLAALTLLLGAAAVGPVEPASAAVPAAKPVKPPKPGGGSTGSVESPSATRRVGAMAREWKISSSASAATPSR